MTRQGLITSPKPVIPLQAWKHVGGLNKLDGECSVVGQEEGLWWFEHKNQLSGRAAIYKNRRFGKEHRHI